MMALLALAGSLRAQTPTADSAATAPPPAQAAFVACPVPSIRVYKTDRLPFAFTGRTVRTEDGDKTVTMLDGYRVLYVWPPAEALLNTKTERFVATSYPNDRANLIANLRFYVNTDTTIGPMLIRRIGSRDAYVISRHQLAGGTLAIAEIFDDARYTVSTIYFLNADPAQRHFQTMAEFSAVVDRVLDAFGACPTF